MALVDEWWFSYLNRVAEARTLTGGDEIAGFEVDNVINAREDNVWRVSDPTMTLSATLDNPSVMQAVIIRVYPGTAWGASEEATLNFSDMDMTSSELGSWTIPLDADPFTGCVVYINETPITATYFHMTMPSQDIEHVHIGPLFLPRNFNRGPDASPEFAGVIERSLFTSQKSVQAGPQTDRFTGQFEPWDLAEYQAWRTFSRTVGITGSFAFGVSQTTQLSESYIAHLTTSLSMRPVDNRWIGQLQLEALR